jgi:hypothetical protein
MTQKHGRKFELDLFNGINDITPEEVWVTTAGYSGNAKGDGCDLVITVDPKVLTKNEPQQINCEAKKRQGEGGKRVSNVFTGSEKEETGVEELKRLVVTTPAWADPIVALKFDRRKLVVLDARWILDAIGERDCYVPANITQGIMEVLDPRTTPSGNISMFKPTLTEWESSRAAPADEVELCERLGLPHET